MKFFSGMCLLLLISTAVFAAKGDIEQTENILSPDNEPYLNAVFGVSPFLGVLGIEYQNKNHAFGIGAPGNLSYKYYARPYQDTKFWGVFLGGYSSDDANRSVNGINYSEIKSRFIGAGIGYRWQWSSGWNTSVSISLEYVTSDYSNPGTFQETTENRVLPFPGFNVGYKF